jgi:hypothetical protein
VPGGLADPWLPASDTSFTAGVVGNAFDAGLPESLATVAGLARDEPFALLHQLAEE